MVVPMRGWRFDFYGWCVSDILKSKTDFIWKLKSNCSQILVKGAICEHS